VAEAPGRPTVTVPSEDVHAGRAPVIR
jgi:hypothetical protein